MLRMKTESEEGKEEAVRELGELKERCSKLETSLAASEATTASKQPRRSNLASDLKSVTPITYSSMCILII